MNYILKTTLIGLFFGTFGTTLGGIIGVIKYVIPVGFLVLTVCIAKNDRTYITSKFVQYGILNTSF